MILVDTSVWIDFFHGRSPRLSAALESGEVAIHPFVVGELALGALGRRRAAILADLQLLPAAPRLAESEVLALVESRALSGSGIGWVDAHILASALASDAALWSLDRRLGRCAQRIGLRAGRDTQSVTP